VLGQQFQPLLLAPVNVTGEAELELAYAWHHLHPAGIAPAQLIELPSGCRQSRLLLFEQHLLSLNGGQGMAQLQLSFGAGSSCHGSTLPRSSCLEKGCQPGTVLSDSKLSSRGSWRALTRVLAWVVQPLLQSSPPLAHQHVGSFGRGGLLGLGDVGP